MPLPLYLQGKIHSFDFSCVLESTFIEFMALISFYSLYEKKKFKYGVTK
jgi:hypothetical protein